MNFSGISNNTPVGKLLRLPLQLIPPQMKIPILQGKLRGFKWIVGSSNHGCWLGSYEWGRRRLFEETVKEGNIVFDIGAHVGFYTLLASALVGPAGKVFAFEPLSQNVSYLKEHLRINKVENVVIHEAAVFDRTGTAPFDLRHISSQGRISSQGDQVIDTVSLDELIANGEIPNPDYIKIDVEGTELKVLLGAEEILSKAYPTILLDTHSPETNRRCCEFLKSLGYCFKPIGTVNVSDADTLLAVI